MIRGCTPELLSLAKLLIFFYVLNAQKYKKQWLRTGFWGYFEKKCIFARKSWMRK